ncbi:acid protease [Hymenopellis radicata]|nr:acid protease [Hymenopellis radicata]
MLGLVHSMPHTPYPYSSARRGSFRSLARVDVLQRRVVSFSEAEIPITSFVQSPLLSLYRPSRNPLYSHPHAPVQRGNSPLYDPSASTTRIETGAPITITYLVGSVQGIIVWDTVGLDLSDSIQGEDDDDADDNGVFPWTISSQALAAASALTSEPLRPNFSGVLGLSPPLNSLISKVIPATDGGNGSTVDGASWVSNVWSSSGTPPLQESNWMEPSSDSYPPFWGGKLGNMSYTRPIASLDSATNQVIGTTLWRVGLSALSVGGKPITLISSSSTAILDSGVPTILASKAIADGIYGAVGVGPGGDGNYYIPCSTEISLNVTLRMNLSGGDIVFPVHPLDLTERRGGKDECMGTVQASTGIPDNEIVLGVAFLKSVETILGYDGLVGVNGNGGSGGVKLGLRSLIDIATADSEWHQVRVDGHALGGSPGSGGSGNSNSNSSGGGISKVGLVALAVIGSLAGFCILMFLVWRWVSIRRERREHGDYATAAAGSPTTPYFPNQSPPSPEDKTYLFGLIKRKNRGKRDSDVYPLREMSEDEKRQKRFDEYIARQRRSEYSDFGPGTGLDKDRTLVASGSTFNKDLALFSGDVDDKTGQEVLYNGYGKEDPWDPSTGLDWGGRVGERDVLLSTEGAETRGERIPAKEDAT